jgi:ribosomal-protein-alanine N-acetyltransferase
MKIVFETERLIVRLFQENDDENCFLLNSNENVMRYIRPTKNKEESDIFLKEIIQSASIINGRWAICQKSTQTFIGSFGIFLFPVTGHIQLGYSLLPAFWGKGYATELTKQGIQFFFENYDLPCLYAYTELENLDSQRVLLKSKFQKMGEVESSDKKLIEFMICRS